MAESFETVSSHSKQASTTRISWLELGLHSYIKILIIGVLFWWTFRYEIERIVFKWISDPSWSHGFLIPFFSLYFINQRKKEILTLRSRPNYVGLFFLLCCLLFYILNMSIPSLRATYIRQVLMVTTLGTIVFFLCGWQMVQYTWLAVFFLIFAIPLPQGYYIRLTMPMRKLAAVIATALLNLVGGLEASVSGVIIDVFYKGKHMEPALNVAEACSGMRLLMAFLALGVAMAYLHYRPIWQRMVLLASTIPIAIFCNIVRVTVTGFIHVFIDPKYAQGFYHDILGMGMLVLAFGLYYFIAWFMSNLFIEPKVISEEDVIVRKSP
jgi:exosortase